MFTAHGAPGRWRAAGAALLAMVISATVGGRAEAQRPAEPAGSPGLEFIDTSFENASPLWYDVAGDVVRINLIYDHDWHLFLIDHSRAFTSKKDLKGLLELGRVDRRLWEKMAALTIDDLDRGLDKWVGNNEKKALLQRRDLMAKNIAAMIAKRGEKSVYYE